MSASLWVHSSYSLGSMVKDLDKHLDSVATASDTFSMESSPSYVQVQLNLRWEEKGEGINV